MMNRIFLALVVLAGLARPAWPQSTTQPAPQLKLRATAVASDEVDLSWYDDQNLFKRYLVCRSTDSGKTFKPIGWVDGGDKTGPHYTFNDLKGTEETTYDYLLEAPDKTPISDVAEARTPQKTLLEVASGQSKLQFSDFLSISFWKATGVAALVWLLGFLPRLLVGALIFALFYAL